MFAGSRSSTYEKGVIIKLIWKGSLFYHYQPIKASLKLRMYLILTREEISKNSFYYIQNVCIISYIRIFLFDKISI